MPVFLDVFYHLSLVAIGATDAMTEQFQFGTQMQTQSRRHGNGHRQFIVVLDNEWMVLLALQMVPRIGQKRWVWQSGVGRGAGQRTKAGRGALGRAERSRGETRGTIQTGKQRDVAGMQGAGMVRLRQSEHSSGDQTLFMSSDETGCSVCAAASVLQRRRRTRGSGAVWVYGQEFYCRSSCYQQNQITTQHSQ